MHLRTPLALSLLLAAACTDEKDPMVTTATVPTMPSSGDPGTTTAAEGTTDVGGTTGEPTTGDGGGSAASQTSPTTASDPGTSAGSVTNMTTDPTTTTTDPTTMTTVFTDPSTDPSTTTTTDPTTMTTDPSTTGDPDEGATQLCVDTINMYRASIGLPALARWTDAEACADGQSKADGEANSPHSTFPMCGESAQNQCPGYPGTPETMIEGCMAQMWAEGPGEDFSMHGHYINMSNPSYTEVACGYAIVNGKVWATQDFR